MNTLQHINARGYANGWHSDMLRIRAQHREISMADQFACEVIHSSAFNVPAQAVAVVRHANQYSGAVIRYQFADESTIELRLPA